MDCTDFSINLLIATIPCFVKLTKNNQINTENTCFSILFTILYDTKHTFSPNYPSFVSLSLSFDCWMIPVSKKYFFQKKQSSDYQQKPVFSRFQRVPWGILSLSHLTNSFELFEATNDKAIKTIIHQEARIQTPRARPCPSYALPRLIYNHASTNIVGAPTNPRLGENKII